MLAFHDPKENPKSICAAIIRGCNIGLYGNDLSNWWVNIAKKTITKKITAMRNDRMKLFKWEFFGK